MQCFGRNSANFENPTFAVGYCILKAAYSSLKFPNSILFCAYPLMPSEFLSETKFFFLAS